MIITKILDGLNKIDEAIKLSSDSLMAGNPIVFPTETVYGVGSLIFNENSIKKVYEIKNRNLGNPLSAHISSLDDVQYLCSNIPEDFWKLADKFLPGPISIVLNRSNSVSNLVTGNIQSLNIRMPDHEIFRLLSYAIGQPIAGTSANLSGRPSANSALIAYQDLNGKVEYILNGGKCKYSIESTVLSMIADEPILVRPGVIDQKDIEKVIGKKIISADKHLVSLRNSHQSAIIDSKYKIFTSDSIEEIINYIATKTKQILILISRENFEKIDHEYKIYLSVETLFENIRYAEKNNFDEIIILFDNFVNNLELIKHRLKFAEKLK